MQKRAKTEGIGGGIPPDKICHRIFAFSGTLVIFKQRCKHATPVGLYIVVWPWPAFVLIGGRNVDVIEARKFETTQ